MLKIAVCDDNNEESKALGKLLENFGGLKVSFFDSGESFLKNYRDFEYDIVFMDIYMGDINGIDTVKKIRKTDNLTPFVFITTSSDHALESYKIGAVGYLEKPIKKEQLYNFLHLAEALKEKLSITLNSGKKQVKLRVFDIMYAEQHAHDILLFMSDNRVIKSRGNLDDILPVLSSEHFFRTHKSFIINPAHISSLNSELMIFTMENGNNVHISRRYFKEAKNLFEEYLFGMG